mgnify:CR=1 FL=1
MFHWKTNPEVIEYCMFMSSNVSPKSKTKRTSLSVVMPAYNEEGVIEEVVRSFCKEVLERFDAPEFIVVNDASTDATPRILAKLAYPYLKVITHGKNRGHGPSLMDGLHAASGAYVFCADSDRQIQPQEFWLLWEAMQKQHGDVVTGFRKKRKDSVHRFFISKVLRIVTFLLFAVSLRDINCPFKLYRRDALHTILNMVPRNALLPSVCMMVSAHELKLRVLEVPVTHYPRKTGKSFARYWKIIALCWQATKELLMLKRTMRKR